MSLFASPMLAVSRVRPIRAQIVNLLEDLQAQTGISYLFIAHDLNLVEHISDDVAVMCLGRIVEKASAEGIYNVALLVANPIPDSETKRERIVLGGDVPNPMHPPAGCHFHPRCPLVSEACMASYPEFREYSSGHWVACHNACKDTVRAAES